MARKRTGHATVESVTSASPHVLGDRRRTSWIYENRVGLLALIASGGLVLSWAWWKGLHAPHRVCGIPTDGILLGIRGDELIYQPSDTVVVSRSIHSGRVRPILSAQADRALEMRGPHSDSRPDRPWTQLQLIDQGLLYIVDEGARQPDSGVQGSDIIPRGATSTPRSFEYRAVSQTDLHGLVPRRKPSRYRAYLRTLDSGDPARLVAGSINSTSVILSGQYVYTVDAYEWPPLPSSLRMQESNGVMRIPVLPPCNRLTRSRIDGGSPSVVVAFGMNGTCLPWQDGVQWIQTTAHSTSTVDLSPGSRPAPRETIPNTTASLYRLRNDSMTPQVLPEYDSQFVPVDLGSRLYWIGQHYGASGVGPGELVLMSCDNDLRHVTELARFRAAGRVWNIGPSNLLAKGRSLYVLIAGSMDLAGHGAPGLERAQINGSSLTLFRIALKPQVSVQVAARFPNGVSKVLVDGARLYAVVDEVREKWFEWSGPGTGSMLEKSLYVYNLPE